MKLCFNTVFYYFGITRPADQEMTLIEKTVCYTHRFQEKQEQYTTGCHTGEEQVEDRKSRENGGPLLWFLWKEKVIPGNQV